MHVDSFLNEAGAHSEIAFSHKVNWSSENRFGRAEIYHQPVKEISTDFYITATSLIMCAGHDFVTVLIHGYRCHMSLFLHRL